MAVASSKSLPERLAADWYTRREAAEVLRISLTSLDRKAAAGHLERTTYNGLTMVSRKSVEVYLTRFRVR